MDYEAILTEAHDAATQAILDRFKAGHVEQPMSCGFAWVTVPGNSGLARHCRKFIPTDPRKRAVGVIRNLSRYGDKGLRGWQWWKPGTWPAIHQLAAEGVDVEQVISVYQQDVDFHYDAAKAFAEVLNTRVPNLGAAADMRLD